MPAFLIVAATISGRLDERGVGMPDDVDGGPQPERPFHLRLPGFMVDEEVGLGDVISHVTYAIGIKPCNGCKQRAAALNRRVVITPVVSKRK